MIGEARAISHQPAIVKQVAGSRGALTPFRRALCIEDASREWVCETQRTKNGLIVYVRPIADTVENLAFIWWPCAVLNRNVKSTAKCMLSAAKCCQCNHGRARNQPVVSRRISWATRRAAAFCQLCRVRSGTWLRNHSRAALILGSVCVACARRLYGLRPTTYGKYSAL
jgi:hypothetical protein